jgi:multidrug efflux pump subunit AcrB
MLTGTLVTVTGFIPIGLNSSNAGEFTFTLFVVLAVSLLVSWVVAVLFTPLLGVTILPSKMKAHHPDHKGLVSRMFHSVLVTAVRFRWLTILATVLIFGVSLYGMRFVQQQFFPSSDRHELIVDWNLPQNSAIAGTNAQMAKFETDMLKGNPDIEHWSTYVGSPAPRFVLSFDVSAPDVSFGQTIIVTKSLAARDQLRQTLQAYLNKTFPGTDTNVKLLDIGPPVGRPVQYRVSGPDFATVREKALDVAKIMRANSHLNSPVFNWMEPARVVKVDVNQDKARQLGLSSSDIAASLNGVLAGTNVTQVRDDIYLVDVVARAQANERDTLATLRNLQLGGPGGQAIPLAAVATLRYEMEQPTI